MALPKTLQVSCVQTHWTKTLEHNLERTIHYINEAAVAGSRVALFPEANLTGYYFPYLVRLPAQKVQTALNAVCDAAADAGIWVIAGTIQKTANKFLNLAHVIDPRGKIVHEYAKVNLAGRDEKKYCRGGDKLSLFEIDGILCTMVICRAAAIPSSIVFREWQGRRYFSIPHAVQMKSTLWLGNGAREGRSSPLAPIVRCSIASQTPLAKTPKVIRRPAAGRLSASPMAFRLPRLGITRRR